jgi:hypothetical protein
MRIISTHGWYWIHGVDYEIVEKKMRKEFKTVVLGVLFFGAIWGLSEAVLGGYLYRNSIPLAPVPLTVIALVILTVAKRLLPFAGSATLVAAFAMLYKFLNLPFFACHLLGILMLGISYDLCFTALKAKNNALKAILTCLISYMVFTLLMTFIVRYKYWVDEGTHKMAEHIFVSGGLSAVLSAIAVPLTIRAMNLKEVNLRGRWIIPQIVSYACWLFAIGMFIKAIV